LLPAKSVGIWLSSFLTLGVLPVALLWIITGFSVWTLYTLFWLLIALGYVSIVIGKFHGSEKQEVLLHAGLSAGYFSLMLILFFGLAIPLLGTVAMFVPLGPDSVNQWFIAKKTRRLIVLRVLVYVLVISVLLWINSRL
jgi:hypothetical protein